MLSKPIAVVVALLLIAAIPRPGHADQGADARWINVLDVGTELVNQKKLLPVDNQTAKSLFGEKYPLLRDNWRQSLPKSLESVAKPQKLPKLQKGLFRQSRQTDAYPRIIRFTDRRLVVAIVRPLGSYLWHHYYDCLALIELNRTPSIDKYFNVSRLEQTYDAQLKGISQGSTAAEVEQALGKPDRQRHTQAVGCFEFTYNKPAVKVWFESGRVLRINPIKPTGIEPKQ